MRTILHVDMDAFFASVEMLVHPEWRGKPLVVGAGPHERGVVSTCSYEARRYGVRSAMPSRTAYEKCPHGIFVRPRMHVYHEVSDAAFGVFARYSPFVEGVSVDEAFRKGAAAALETALREQPDIIILQSRSPSCGVKQIYDGTFSGNLIPGMGVFAEMVKKAGFRVADAEDLYKEL